MTEEIIIDECFNCKKKKDIGDNWRTCKLKCSYKYKRKENDYITRLEQENKALKDNNNHLQAIIDDGRAENKRFREENKELKETVKDLNQSIQNCNIQRTKMYKALEEIKSAIVEYLPKNPAQYALLEYIQIQINEVLG